MVDDVDCVIVNVPLLSLHIPEPLRLQLPVIAPPLSGGWPSTSVPVTLPVKLSVLPDA